MWEYNCLGDTTIDNIAYKKIFRRSLIPSNGAPPFTPASYYWLYGFMRDDVAAKKVYARILPNNIYSFDCGFDEDILLYDFSLEVNDTVDFCLVPSFYQSSIYSIVSEEVLGVNTNIFMLNNGMSYYEGIGSEFGLFEDIFIPIKSTNELERTELAYYCPSGVCGYTLPDVTLLTVGEVFDFSVGDKFHYRGNASGQTPNADRLTIIGKFYSQDNDTVSYQREHNSYYTVLNWNNSEPYLEYFFNSFMDTVSYTNLNEPLSVYDNNLLSSVNIFYGEDWCDTLINNWYFNNNPGGMPGEEFDRSYGKGLGLTLDYHYSGDGQQVLADNKLIYYKKGNVTCGNPDVVSAKGEMIESTIRIYPNPAQNEISFTANSQLSGNASYQLFSVSGNMIGSGTLTKDSDKISTTSLPSGMYLIKIVTPTRVLTGKFLIAK